MKKLNNNINKGINLSIVFIAITFPLPFRISNLGIISLVIFWIAQKIVSKSKPNYSFKSNAEKWVFYSIIAFFIWQILSLFYTYDIANGLKNVESKFSLLVFPMVLFDLRPSWEKITYWLKCYVYSIALCTVYLLARSITHYFTNGSLLTYHEFTNSLSFHAVFYSYNIFLSVLITGFLFSRKELSSIEKALFIISLILSFVGLLICSSKNVLVVTTLFLLLGFFIRMAKRKIQFKEIVLVILIVLGGGFGISKVPVLKTRIVELTQLNGMENLDKIKRGEMIVKEDIPKFNGTSLRITFWYVVLHKMIDEDVLLLGYSPGDRREKINQEFYKIGLNPWYKDYNIHNQFVQVFAELGIIGLILYLVVHFSLLLTAIKNRNLLLALLVAGFAIFQMTESIIERNKGIVFFVFFLILLTQLKPKLDENRNIRD
jgi:O-antigen ligase